MGRTKIFEPEQEIENICTWIKNYFVENGPNSKAVIGISGGKDSTVAAMLLVKALGENRVVGVMMPESVQKDIDDSRRICNVLGIQPYEVDIGPACAALYRSIDEAYDFDHTVTNIPAITTNTPCRIRMSTLYVIAALVGGRVANTCNWSEDYVGYSTKYGDLAGDFAILSRYTVREVITMGCVLAKEFGIPVELIAKTPSDGMCGKTDEDNLGFTYDTLDSLLLDGIVPEYEIYKNIRERHKRNEHKTRAIRLPAPSPLVFRARHEWEYDEECFAF